MAVTLIDRPRLLVVVGSNLAAVEVCWRGFMLRVGPARELQAWGYVEDWWNGPIPAWCAGPWLRFSYMYSIRESLGWPL